MLPLSTNLPLHIVALIFFIVTLCASYVSYKFCLKFSPSVPPTKYVLISALISAICWMASCYQIYLSTLNLDLVYLILAAISLITVSSFTDGILKLVYTPLIGLTVLLSVLSTILYAELSQDINDVFMLITFAGLFWCITVVGVKTEQADDYILLGVSLMLVPFGLRSLIVMYVTFTVITCVMSIIILRLKAQELTIAYIPVIFISFSLAIFMGN